VSLSEKMQQTKNQKQQSTCAAELVSVLVVSSTLFVTLHIALYCTLCCTLCCGFAHHHGINGSIKCHAMAMLSVMPQHCTLLLPTLCILPWCWWQHCMVFCVCRSLHSVPWHRAALFFLPRCFLLAMVLRGASLLAAAS